MPNDKTRRSKLGPGKGSKADSSHEQKSEKRREKSSSKQSDQIDADYQLLLTPLFSAMTRITSHLFLTGVGGMTRENFRKNHIDFVVNITTEAPFWEEIESMRLPLEDDTSTNILAYLDTAVDRINEAIVKRDAHVLVHCVAGVSRSATIVIAYLMKHRRMNLREAFNYCYNLRPVIRPNNGFMLQLINYELQIFNKTSVQMVDVEVDETRIKVPQFFVSEHPRLVLLEVMRAREMQSSSSSGSSARAASGSNNNNPSNASSIVPGDAAIAAAAATATAAAPSTNNKANNTREDA